MSKYRKPPKPAAYDSPPGYCRYCGHAIVNAAGKLNLRANWHPPCVETYRVIYWPQETRKAVWRRDRGQCANCPTRFGSLHDAWHVDHHRPLIEAQGDIDYWLLPNLKTLCTPCHAAKTKEEAGERARKRREGLLPPVKRRRKS